MRFVIIFIIICLSTLLHAQKKQGQEYLDSLLKELPKQKEDTNKEELLHAVAYRYLQIDPAECLKYGKLELALAEHLNYKKGIASSYFVIGQFYNVKGNLPEALNNISAAMKLFQEIDNKKGISSCYSSIGLIWSQQDNYPEALRNFFSALELEEKIGDIDGTGYCRLNIGATYIDQNNRSEALKNDQAALKIGERVDDKRLIATSLINIANVNNSLGNDQDALKNAEAAIAISRQLNDKYGVANCYNIIGNIYYRRKKYAEALKNYAASAAMLQEFGANLPLADALGGIGDILYQQKKYSEAEKYFNKELYLAKEVGSLGVIKNANQSLSDLYDKTGEYKKSAAAYKSFIVARDSIFNEENTKKTLQAKMQYDFDKKETAILAAQSKKDAIAEQRRKVFIYSTISAFIVLLIIGALLLRQYKLKAEHQKITLEQKQLRSQMNPHFIFNCLNSIQHFVVAGDTMNANKYLSGFALLMRQTLENSKEGTITLRREIAYLKNYLSLETLLFEDKFSYEIYCAENIDLDSVEMPAMIIQPFVENAIRHGLCYLKNRQGLLKINFYLQDRYLFCEIDDNGIGREQAQKLKTASGTVYESHGMELTRQRLALVSKATGGDYQISITDKADCNNEATGTTVTIKFPIDI